MKNEDYIEIPPYSIERDGQKTSELFYEKMAKRRSIRSFSPEPIDKSILLNAIKTAGTAPSGANRQPWHFALITSLEKKIKIRQAAERVEEEFYSYKATEEWLSDLKPFGTNAIKTYLSEAPALIAVFSRTMCHDEGSLRRSYYPIESTGIAVGLLLAALHNAGLATLTHTPKPMFFLNELLNFDKSYRPYIIVVVGKPKIPVRVPNIHRKKIAEIMTEF